MAKKVPMDKLRPFCREIPGFEMSAYSGGAKFRNGDTIMARITPCLENGKTAKVNILSEGEVGFGSTEYIVFRAKPGVADADFLYYLVCSPTVREPAIQSMVGSSGRQRVQNGVLEQLEVLLPPLEVQRAIGAVLRALDDKIALNTRINDNLTQQAQAIFKAWFVDFLPFGEARPAKWELSNIYKLSDIIYGAPFKSKLFNTKGDGIPIVRIRDLKSTVLNTYTTELPPNGYLLRDGDIVVGMDGEFRPYIWANGSAWLNQRVCVFANKRPQGKFFLFFTIAPLLYEIEQTEQATTVIHIGKQDFDRFEFYYPDEESLNQFDSLTMPIYQAIVKNQEESIRLAEIRDALLPRLMSGELECE